MNEKLKKNLKKKKKDIQQRNIWKDEFCSSDDCESCVAYKKHRNKKIVTRQTYDGDIKPAKRSKGTKIKNTLYASCDTCRKLFCSQGYQATRYASLPNGLLL